MRKRNTASEVLFDTTSVWAYLGKLFPPIYRKKSTHVECDCNCGLTQQRQHSYSQMLIEAELKINCISHLYWGIELLTLNPPNILLTVGQQHHPEFLVKQKCSNTKTNKHKLKIKEETHPMAVLDSQAATHFREPFGSQLGSQATNNLQNTIQNMLG